MTLLRAPLLITLLDWKEEEQEWRAARKRLKRAVNKIHRKVERKVDKFAQRGPRENQTGEEFSNWLLNKQDRVRKKLFRRHRDRLSRLQDRESTAFNQYVDADRKRRERETMLRPRPAKFTQPRGLSDMP